jgi:hypothetical protein
MATISRQSFNIGSYGENVLKISCETRNYKTIESKHGMGGP